MIRRLRRRFVLIAALSLLVVEGLIIGLINMINFYQIGSNEDKLLEIIVDNDGKFPDFGKHDKPEDMHGEMLREMNDSGSQAPPIPEEDMAKKGLGFINEETRYRTRFFSVTFDQELSATAIDTGNVAAVTSDQALEYANEAVSSENDKGYIDNYKYVVTKQDDGDTLAVFLDCRDDMQTKQRFLLMSLGISLGGYALVCLLIIICSKFAVKPFIENFEKQKMFITDAGHEIKTPLAIISANTEVIEMTSEPSEWTQSIKNQIERLNGLIANLLRLSRMDEENAKVAFAEFDYSKAFGEIAKPFETLAATKGLGFDLQCQEDIKIFGDEASLRQLVSILIENAVKYCDEGGQIDVSLKTSQSGKHAVIEVANDCTHPPKDPDRLFDRFYRADQSRVRDNGETRSGYGIGLSVARAICESHKGRISCKTEDGLIKFIAVLRTSVYTNKQKNKKA